MTSKIIKFIFTLFTILCLGLVYSWSIFVAPLEAEFGWDRAETSLTFTISIMAMCLGVLLGGQFNKHKNKPLITAVIAAVLMLIGFIVVSRASSLIVFYIFYGVFCGFGIGFIYVEAIAVATKWFPGRQGLTSGALMMCYGLGAMIFGTICSSLMETVGWRNVFLGIGIVFGVIVLIDGCLLQTTVKEENVVDREDAESRNKSFTSKEMIKSSDFKLIYLWTMLLSAAGLALIGHMVPCAVQIGAGATTAALLAGIVSVCNGVGRVFYGVLYDTLGIKKTVLTIGVIFLISTIIACIAVLKGNIIMLAIGCAAIGISFGAAPTSSSVTINKFYGERYFSSNFGIVSTQLMFAAIIGPFFAGKLFTVTGSYISTFYGVAGLGVVCLVITLVLLKVAKSNGREL